CGCPRGNHDHFLDCPLTKTPMENLMRITYPFPPPAMHPVDYTLNLLPQKIPSTYGLWIVMWQRLYIVLHKIDQATSDETFDPEPPPSALLIAAFNRHRRHN
ncbi:hypothetical protein EC973_005987, partial [Apophysomyces ossiformis]